MNAVVHDTLRGIAAACRATATERSHRGSGLLATIGRGQGAAAPRGYDMEISLASAEERNAVYWRSRARESRETARRMISTGPRQGMLKIASIYERLAAMAELDHLPPALPEGVRLLARS